MDYTYFKVLDTDNNIVFECVNDDIYSQVYYNDTWWKLLDLTTHFLDNKFTIKAVGFTTEELNCWIMQRNESN